MRLWTESSRLYGGRRGSHARVLERVCGHRETGCDGGRPFSSASSQKCYEHASTLQSVVTVNKSMSLSLHWDRSIGVERVECVAQEVVA